MPINARFGRPQVIQVPGGSTTSGFGSAENNEALNRLAKIVKQQRDDSNNREQLIRAGIDRRIVENMDSETLSTTAQKLQTASINKQFADEELRKVGQARQNFLRNLAAAKEQEDIRVRESIPFQFGPGIPESIGGKSKAPQRFDAVSSDGDAGGSKSIYNVEGDNEIILGMENTVPKLQSELIDKSTVQDGTAGDFVARKTGLDLIAEVLQGNAGLTEQEISRRAFDEKPAALTADEVARVEGSNFYQNLLQVEKARTDAELTKTKDSVQIIKEIRDGVAVNVIANKNTGTSKPIIDSEGKVSLVPPTVRKIENLQDTPLKEALKTSNKIITENNGLLLEYATLLDQYDPDFFSSIGRIKQFIGETLDEKGLLSNPETAAEFRKIKKLISSARKVFFSEKIIRTGLASPFAETADLKQAILDIDKLGREGFLALTRNAVELLSNERNEHQRILDDFHSGKIKTLGQLTAASSARVDKRLEETGRLAPLKGRTSKEKLRDRMKRTNNGK